MTHGDVLSFGKHRNEHLAKSSVKAIKAQSKPLLLCIEEHRTCHQGGMSDRRRVCSQHMTMYTCIQSTKGLGHYLSPWWGRRILGGGGVTWCSGDQKGGSVVTKNPKGGDGWKLWKDLDLGGGRGSRKSSKVIREDPFSEVTMGGSAKFHLV